MGSGGTNSAGGAESGSTASRAALEPARPVPSPRTGERAGFRAFWGQGRDRASCRGGREKPAVGVRPSVLQTDGASAETPGTGSRASRLPEERLGAPGVGGRPEGVSPLHLGPSPPSPATNTTKTAPLLLADAMAAGMAPWNHSIAPHGPRRSLGVLSPRSRSWPRPLRRLAPRPPQPQPVRTPPPALHRRSSPSAAHWTRASAQARRTPRHVTPHVGVSAAPPCLVSLASRSVRVSARPQGAAVPEMGGGVGKND